jgi:hypothetical protein
LNYIYWIIYIYMNNTTSKRYVKTLWYQNILFQLKKHNIYQNRIHNFDFLSPTFEWKGWNDRNETSGGLITFMSFSFSFSFQIIKDSSPPLSSTIISSTIIFFSLCFYEKPWEWIKILQHFSFWKKKKKRKTCLSRFIKHCNSQSASSSCTTK